MKERHSPRVKKIAKIAAGSRGFGLPEILISLFLSSFILLALVNQYLGIKKEHQQIEAWLGQNTEVQLLIDLMRDSVRRAGFTPCLTIPHLLTSDVQGKPLFSLAIKHKPATMLIINRMHEEFDEISAISDSNQVRTKTRILKAGQTILIADCYHAETSVVKSIKAIGNGQIVDLMNPLIFNYQQPAYIGEWLEEKYFIRKVKNQNALYYGRNRFDELAPFVDDLAVQLLRKKDNILVRIILDLNHGKNIQFDTKLRA
ncbi:PulJ/GspJ family protein [Legionella londiniensis]|uniref:Tfp pilus assembly protein PilW n=1 Tax=Legionella londiniensis TaxID=45068 RepID=A0A0W0VP63_9GAMM|nr:hypothetical protein [Legionella londiniensis]KTD21834.1 hypothetical protein Llon_0999 [Legionella londiniensis]STX92683.1 Tfp pilus assembly protein PilW [Legionella londiniensis]